MAFQEYTVAQVGDLKNGQMKEVQAGETAVLLALVDETYYAYYPKCTHYGAPLAKGILDGHRLVCPWHHACFDSTSGKRTEFPAVDGLPSYEVIVRDKAVVVRLPDQLADRVAPPMPVGQSVEAETYVILGGGPAGLNAAIGMREGGFRGRIVLITSDSQLPYDRTKCSKEYLQGKTPEEKMYLRPDDFYPKHDIETVKERVTNVDMEARNVAFETRAPLAYDKILICTGGQPRPLTVPGAEKANVHLLRTWLDSRELREDATDLRRAVIIGSSFIGLEGAMSLQKLGCEVTVVAPQNVPFESVWGAEVGRQVQRWHQEAGVQFRLGRQVTELAGTDCVTEVVLDNGERLPTDLVLVGIGVQPATAMLSGVALEKDGGVTVDAYLQLRDNVYAAGDIAHVPYGDGPVRIEHWKVAGQQGYIAGLNMAGADRPYDAVPFFWTVQQGRNVRYVGHVEGFDRVFFDGNPADDSFIAYYVKEGRIRAALGVKRDTELTLIQELLYKNRMPSPDAVEQNPGIIQQVTL